MVPVASIVCMAVSAVVAIGLPVGLFLGLRRTLGLRVVPMVVGVAVFIVFALVLESLMHQVVLRPAPDGTIAMRATSPWLYVAYGALAAGVFEETGRLVGFTILKRRFRGVRTAVSYGIGHGGVEAIILVGITMISDLVISAMINNGSDFWLQQTAVVTPLTTEPSWMFLVAGGERVFAIVLHLSLSILVWMAVTHPKRRWLFPLAILLHAVSDVPAAMMQAGLLANVAVVELTTAVVSLAVAAYAVMWFRRAQTEERLAVDATV